jgi:iron complex transport system substrate-binding protein
MNKIVTLVFIFYLFVLPVSSSATRHLIDGKGNHIEVPDTVTRVAANGAVNQIVLLLGAGDKIVATSVIVQKNPLFVKVFPEIKTIPGAFAADRKSLNMEELISARPQVVFGSFDQLKGKGIAMVELDLTSSEKIKEAILLVGQILGKEEEARARDYIYYYESIIKEATAKTASLSGDEKPLVYVASGQDGLTSEGINTITDEWITVAGGKNLAAQFPVTQKIALEDIIAADPDIIIANSATVKAKIMSGSKWAMLKAVKTGQVYTNPKGVYLWSVRSAEGVLQFLWASKIIHPELFSDLDIDGIVTDYYNKYYNYHLSKDELSEILNQK